LAVMVEAADLALAVGDLEWENHALSKRLYGEIIAGDLAAARVTARRHREVANLVGQPLFRAIDCQAHALLALGEGRFDDAEELAAAADELASSLSGAPAGGYGVQLFSIRREQGRLDEARPIVEAVAGLRRSGSTWRPALAVMYAELGLNDDAATEVAQLTADRLAAVPRDALWHASLSYLADACQAVGDRDAAAAVYAALLPWRGRVVQVGHLLAAHGAVDRYLAKLADMLGHDREAEIHYEAALRLDRAANMPVWLAHTQLDFGMFLARRTAPADRSRSVALLQDAQSVAQRCGMTPVLQSARTALDPSIGSTTTQLTGLTDRELAVLSLIAEGRSNRDIGRALHISPHTAANHVRSILMKTESANRTEAAAWALRRGVAGSVRTTAPSTPPDEAGRRAR
jgi:DNA-binding CsgD family transcriptional regulator